MDLGDVPKVLNTWEGEVPMRERWPRLTRTIRVLLVSALVVLGLVPIISLQPEPAAEPAAVEATETPKPAVGAAIVVTLRWGRTDTAAIRDADGQRTGAVNWDGYIALDCGAIRRVDPLAFELDDGPGLAPRSYADFVGPVVRGDSGEQRVYWRSQTAAGWDGLRVQLDACDPTDNSNGTADPRAASTLKIYTEQRAYTARLDWSANDFVALSAAEPGQRLEVYITAEYDETSMRGARITELSPADPSPEEAESAPSSRRR